MSFPIRTSRDFELLSEAVADAGAGYLSPSTLKRVWGYVRGSQTRHAATLDIRKIDCLCGAELSEDFRAEETLLRRGAALPDLLPLPKQK